MKSDLFRKYIWLADTIYRKERIKFSEINRLWVSSSLSEGKPMALRTFHNHRAAIEELFDINISCDLWTNEYYIEDGDILSRDIRGWLLNSFSASNLFHENKGVSDRILFEEIPSAQIYFNDILEAIRNNTQINMTYKPFSQPEPRTLNILPYFVKLHERRWYVYGAKTDDPTVKVYALDRVQDIEHTSVHFDLPEDFDPQGHLRYSIGIEKYPDIKPCKVVIRSFSPEYLRALPLHHSQQEVEGRKEYSYFMYYLAPTSEFYREMLRLGDKVEVMLPKSARREMRKLISEISELYN